MDGEYVFVASGDACGVCLALDGTECTEVPHPNCLCQVVPKEGGCEIDYSFSGSYYGPGHYDGSVGGEITVICPDGSEISESFEVELAPYAGTGEDSFDIAVEAFEAEAEALCEQCPEPEPFLCC
jgi:hypothetical protein